MLIASYMPRLYILGYISLCLIWGSTWLGIRVVVRDVPPMLAAALRFFLAAIVLFIWIMFRKPAWPRGAQQWNAVLLLGFTVIALPYGLLFWAEQYVTSSLSAILFSALPLTVALLTPLMLGRTIPRPALLGMVVGLGGLLVAFHVDLPFGTRGFWAGVAILVAMFSAAWSAVYAKLRLQEIDPVISTALQLLTGAVILFWATWALESHRHAVWTRAALFALLFLATLGSAATFAIYYWLLKHMEPYQLSAINLVIPIVAAFEGSWWGETIPLLMVVAMIVVLGSVAVVLRAEAEGKPESLAANSP